MTELDTLQCLGEENTLPNVILKLSSIGEEGHALNPPYVGQAHIMRSIPLMSASHPSPKLISSYATAQFDSMLLVMFYTMELLDNTIRPIEREHWLLHLFSYIKY